MTEEKEEVQTLDGDEDYTKEDEHTLDDYDNIDHYYRNSNCPDERRGEDSIIEASGFDLSLTYSDTDVDDNHSTCNDATSNDDADVPQSPDALAAPHSKFHLTSRQHKRIKEERDKVRRTLINIRHDICLQLSPTNATPCLNKDYI